MRIQVNPDNPDLVFKIREAIRNKSGHCPCKIAVNDDTLCPCKEFRESTELGLCHCGLYKKIEN